jgi:hypothetical protein
MGQPEQATPIAPDVSADLERAVEILMTGRRDPEFERRIHARSEEITREVLKKHACWASESPPSGPFVTATTNEACPGLLDRIQMGCAGSIHGQGAEAPR